MRVRFRELFLLLAVCTLALSETVNKAGKKDAKDSDNLLLQYEDDYDATDDQEILFSEDRPCPRDCICNVSQGYRTAKCNRLEIGTQKFGDDITDLVIENANPARPIHLDDFIFKKLGLHQIATVKIVNSTISSVGANAFYGLHELYAVNLSNNKLTSLHPETFSNNKKLLLLTLSNNPLKFPAPGSKDYFLNASSVQELDISYCNMQYITSNTVKNMPGLMYLNLAGNDLSDMEADTFRSLLDLEELDLSDNNLQTLPDDIFNENTELATLHIQRNPIDSVYGLMISDLLTLNAGQTKIKFVGPSMFNGMTYIANLNLSGNSIEKIHNQAFHKLVELNYLDLSYNDLDFVSSILIKENIELDIFKISNNPRLKHLPAEGFNCSVEQFNIYLFDASNCGLKEVYDDSLKTFTALSQINLSNNNIKSINSRVFSRCTKLVDINLSYNSLTTLDVKVFEKNKDLQKLNLRGNPLKVLSAEIFINTPILNWLDISHAELTSLWTIEKNTPANVLSAMSYLNVSNNRITEIKKTELEGLTKLRTLDIRNNLLACSREFENIMSLLSERKVSPNANAALIANLGMDDKDVTHAYSWESLTKKVCGTVISHPVEHLPEVSDEEIWERVDKDTEDFDLKDTLDDDKVAEDVKTINDISTNKPDLEDAEADEDDDDADDEEDDDSEEDYNDDDDNVDLKVKLIEKIPSTLKPTTEAPQKDKVKIDIKLLENDSLYDDLEPEVYVQATTNNTDTGYGYNPWPMIICVLSAILLLIIIAKMVMVACSRRNRQVRYNSAIIAAMSHASRTKKDCGLVYQQLSEDLTGPTTPKPNRYTPLHNVTVNASNMSYESSPFHHSNIVPEAV